MKSNNPEKSKFSYLAAALSAAVMSGVFSQFQELHFQAAQAAGGLHILFGCLTIVIGLSFTITHIKSSIGVKRLSASLTGMLALAALLAASVNSIELSLNYLPAIKIQLHALLSYILLITILFHSYIGMRSRQSRKKAISYALPAFLRGTGIGTSACFTSIVIITLVVPPPETPFLKITNYDFPYGNNPYWPSQNTTPNQDFIAEAFIGNSSQCASCHSEIAAQWSSSAHRLAAADPTYVTNINLLESKKGIVATRYCEGCHAPVAIMTGELTTGGSHGGKPNTPGNSEGVSCLSCHRIESINHLNGVASYHFSPHTPYLFENSNSDILKRVNAEIVKLFPRRHKSEMLMPVIKSPELCSTCHTQFMDKEMNNWGWVKMQDDYQSWLQSPFSGRKDQQLSKENPMRCQDCHMPLVRSDDPAAGSDGLVRSHRFVGANTMLPKVLGDPAQLIETEQFLMSNKLTVSIEPPHRSNPRQSALHVEELLRTKSETPYYSYLNETLDLSVAVTNIGVGHAFPGGTTDINQPWLEFLVTDAEGDTIYHSGFIDENDFLDKSAHQYISSPVDRHGKAVWKHDLFNMVGESYKNTIAAGKTDIKQYNFTIPAWTKSPIQVTATLNYRKLNTKYARWALKDKYIKLPITVLAQDTLSIDIREYPEVKRRD